MQAYALQLAPSSLPSFRAALAGAAFLGAAVGTAVLLLALLADQLFPGYAPKLAAAALFEKQSWFALGFVAVLWSPVVETLVGQWMSISLMRCLSTSMRPSVIAGASVFSIGHMASGGGWEQGIVTAIVGAVLSWRYVRGLEYGMPGAIALTAMVHASNNAVALCGIALFG
ncbi:MAG TPA: CPBP family glutamic-type intramembrane protease [Telluria sp.]|jgi:hypothetical protein